MGYEKKKRRKSTVAKCVPYSDEQWQIEEDLRCLARAEAVEADPNRMKKVRALAKQRLDESRRKKDEAQKLIDLGTEATT